MSFGLEAESIRPVRLALACLLFGAVAACGGGGGGGGSTTPDSPPPPTGTHAIGVDRTTIDFGSATVGTAVQAAVNVTNTGTLDLTVATSITGDGFETDETCPTLAPDDSCRLSIIFTPNQQGDFSGTLTIDSEASDTPAVEMTGKGEGLNVEVSSTSCDATTVTSRVIVTDALGEPVTTLQQNMFTFSVNGDQVVLSSFNQLENVEPASVGIAVDWSDSLSEFRDQLAQSTDAFIEEFRDVDTAGIFRFAKAIDPNAPDFLVTDAAGKDTLQDSLFAPYGGETDRTHVWDVAIEVLNKTFAEHNPKKAVVLLTDGFDNTDTTVDGLIAEADGSNVQFFVIGFGEVNEEDLRKLADETGGQYFFTPDTTDLNAIYDQVSSILSNQYEVTFDNPSPSTENELGVVVNDGANVGSDTATLQICP